MNKQQATALCMYLNRGFGIIPTTAAEWTVVQGAVSVVEGIANGLITIDVKPVEAISEPKVPTRSAKPVKAD